MGIPWENRGSQGIAYDLKAGQWSIDRGKKGAVAPFLVREGDYNGLVEQRGMDGEGGRVILNGKKLQKGLHLPGNGR